jgi:hypothetical protein
MPHPAIRMSEVQAKRASAIGQRKTPEPKPLVIGSSCTWRGPELLRFKVKVKQNVDPKEMIPQEYFKFDRLPPACYEYYKNCTASFGSFCMS